MHTNIKKDADLIESIMKGVKYKRAAKKYFNKSSFLLLSSIYEVVQRNISKDGILYIDDIKDTLIEMGFKNFKDNAYGIQPVIDDVEESIGTVYVIANPEGAVSVKYQPRYLDFDNSPEDVSTKSYLVKTLIDTDGSDNYHRKKY